MLQLSTERTLRHQVSPETKKLVSVLVTSTLVTRTRKKTVETAEALETAKVIETAETDKDGKKNKSKYQKHFARVLCIRYLINFKKKSVLALLDLSSKVNAVNSAFTKELGLPIRPTDVGAQKIDKITLDIHGIIVAAFSIKNKAYQIRFFEETFLVVNVSPKVVLGMPFFTLSGADVDFLRRELWWRTYTIEKALLITKDVKLVGKKEFAATVLDPEYEIYVVPVGSVSSDASPNFSPLNIYLFRRPQVSGLIVEKASTKISAEYLYFADIFSPKFVFELSKHNGINNHIIELINGQQPPYKPIYSLKLVELEILKAYIGTNLANGFIRPSKSSASALILFERRSDGSL